MKTKLVRGIFFIVGIVAGILFSTITMHFSAGKMMIKEMASPYGFDKTVRTIEENISKKAGWHLVQTIDQQAEVQKYAGKDIGQLKIIQYCNGEFAYQMLNADDRKRVSVMMPKTISVYELSTGETIVASANGAVMGKLFGGETGKIIEKVSLEVEDILRFMNFKFTII
jgi:uncharacterized protein (DUF302 family)